LNFIYLNRQFFDEVGQRPHHAKGVLAKVTIPDSVTSIEFNAFSGCTNLTSVTFQGTITAGNFDSLYSFPGDLRDKYLASNGGAGTYKRFAGGEVWRKQ